MRDKRLLTVGEVASRMGVHTNTVRRWLNDGAMTVYRIGSRGDRRVAVEDVEKFLEEHKREASR